MRTMIFKDTMLLYNTPLNEIGENYGWKKVYMHIYRDLNLLK
jgi:hypothetical protein